MNDWIYDHGSQHLNELHREAEQERLANALPHQPGRLETALNRLFGRRQDNAQNHE